MKKMTALFMTLISLTFFSSQTLAVDGQGTIEEIVNCGTGENTSGNYWRQMLLFRLSDGKWFGVYADYVRAAGTTYDYDSDFAISTVMTAFTGVYPVQVRATYAQNTYCGITAEFLWNTAGDYIKITR